MTKRRKKKGLWLPPFVLLGFVIVLLLAWLMSSPGPIADIVQNWFFEFARRVR